MASGLFTRTWNAVLNHFGVHDARNEPTCCPRPAWVKERDLQGANGFEFDLGRCQRCGTPCMRVYCAATSRGGFEPVTSGEADRLMALPDEEIRETMRAWSARLFS